LPVSFYALAGFKDLVVVRLDVFLVRFQGCQKIAFNSSYLNINKVLKFPLQFQLVVCTPSAMSLGFFRPLDIQLLFQSVKVLLYLLGAK
jgi:hypothetical protein